MFNNGHAIQQRYADTGSSIYFEGTEYQLTQFHFHTLSEHTFSSRHSVMELHAVFKELGGSAVVISQLFEIGKHRNRFIQKLIKAGLPPKKDDETATDRLINLADLLRHTRSYYTYSGSLTTPPCSEVVTWVVLKEKVRLTHKQYQEFRRILGNNFRPLQRKNGRVVRVTGEKGSYGHH